jgi:putative membrane protein
MKIKVPLFSKKVITKWLEIIAIISTIPSLFFISVEMPQNLQILYAVITTLVLIILYVTIWICANLKRKTILTINNSNIIIKFGDLFDQDGLKVISFNEYFDTKVDNKIIAESSLNGIYLSNNFNRNQIKKLDQEIANDTHLKSRENGINNGRTNGKKVRYKLGSVFLNGDFLLVAFSRFNDENMAELTLKEYVQSMISFWDEVNRIYAGRSVSIPLMGCGITRYKDVDDIQPQELLKIIVWTFRISRIKFKHPATASIIIHDSLFDQINLYEL